MPLRDLTLQEIQHLTDQGINPKGIKIDTDLEARYQQQQAVQSGSVGNAIAAPLKAHAGGLIGSSGAIPGAVAGGEIGTAILPGLGTAVGGLIGGAAGGLAGSYAGQSAQNAILGPEEQAQLEQEAATASAAHPWISGGTELAAGAIASGGLLSPSNIPKAGKGLIGLLKGGEEGLASTTRRVLDNPEEGHKIVEAYNDSLANKQALANVAGQAIISPALTAGTSLATGNGLPSIGELGKSALTGALFSKSWVPHSANRPSVGEPIPEVTNTADKANPNPGQEVEKGPVSPYTELDEDGNYKVPNDVIKQAWLNKYQVSTKGITDPLKLAEVQTQIKANRANQDFEAQRLQLHNDHLAELAAKDALANAEVKIPDTTSNKTEPTPEVTAKTDPSIVRPAATTADILGTTPKLPAATEAEPNVQIPPKPSIVTPEVAAPKLPSEQSSLPNTSPGNIVRPTGGAAKPLNDNALRILNKDTLLQPDIGRQGNPQTYNDHTSNVEEANAENAKPKTKAELIAEQYERAGNVNSPKQSPIDPEGRVLLPKEVIAHIRSGNATIGSVLGKLSANTEHPFAPLAKALLEASDKASLGVRLFHDATLNDYSGDKRSHYDSVKDKIKLSTDGTEQARTVIEEAVHGMTSRKIPNFTGEGAAHKAQLDHYLKNGKNETIKDLIKSYYKVVEHVGATEKLFGNLTKFGPRQWVNDVGVAGNPDKAAERVNNKPEQGNTGYALGNLHEFIAQAIKDPGFQKVLDGIKADDNRTVWQHIVDAVTNLLKLPASSGSMLEKVLRSSGELINQERPEWSKYEDQEFYNAQQKREREGDFLLNAKHLVDNPHEMGLIPNTSGGFNGTQFVNTLRNKITPTEWEILKAAGIEKHFSGRIINQKEASQWIKDNSPRVEVKKRGEGAASTPEQRRFNELEHYFDSLPREQRVVANHYLTHSDAESFQKLTTEQQSFAKEYEQLNKKDLQKGNEPSHYAFVAPKSEKDMPGYVEIAVVKPFESVKAYRDTHPNATQAEVQAHINKREQSSQFPSSHNFPPNTLGFTRGYMEKDPVTGEKTFHVIEVQSDWAKIIHEKEGDPYFTHDGKKFKTREEAQQYLVKQEPLLAQYERLALKAAIDHAKAEGATRIAMSDAETAMMSEGHDRNLTLAGRNQNEITTDAKGNTIPEPSQAAGMRLHYDRTLPKILEELTGAKGELKNYGEHEKAMKQEARFRPQGQEGAMEQYREPREDLIFRNPDGTPKTSVTARSYPLDKIPDREPKLYGKNYAPKMERGTSRTPEEQSLPPDKYMSKAGNLTRALVDKVHDLPSAGAKTIAKAFKLTLNKTDELKGKWKNPVVEFANKVNGGRGFTDAQLARLNKAMAFEREGKGSGLPLLNTPEEAQWFNLVKKTLAASGEHRLSIGEPVMQPITKGGKTIYVTREMLKKENYIPGMANQKVEQIYRDNTDPAAITKLDKEFHDYNTKVLGMSDYESQMRINNWKEALQGNSKSSQISDQARFNGNRKAAGTPLPPSFLEQNPVRAMERYFDRAATDAAHYEHMEKDHKVLSALGAEKDAWGKGVEKSKDGSLHENPAVRNLLNHWRGEPHTPLEGNEKALTSLITAGFISGPPLEVHKQVSNIVGTMSQAPDVSTLARAVIHGITNINKGYQHAIAGNLVKPTARSYKTMFDGTATAAERMQAAAKVLRSVSTLGGLTTKLGSGMVQAMNEVIIPSKILRAEQGDVTQLKFLRNLDPNFNPNVKHTPEEIQRLASQSGNYIHGTGDARSLPGWMLNDSEFSGFFSLAHWSIAQTNNFMKNVYEPALRGNITPLVMGLFGSVLGGAVIKELREKIQGKKNPIPSLSEISDSDRGLSGNVPLVAYNVIAAMQYAGFGGLLSQVVKVPFDTAYKNPSSGATFPMDEVAGDVFETAHQIAEALANDPNANFVDLAAHGAMHVLSNNFQLGRIAMNQGINSGLVTGSVAEKKMLADKLGQLRRFDMVEGLPYSDIDSSSNPYMNMEQKEFKLEQDPAKAIQQLPSMINNIIKTYGSNPDVMMQKLKALKQNSYETFPSMENTPLSFFKYLGYLQREEGPEAAQNELQDYLKHKLVNQVKSSVVP